MPTSRGTASYDPAVPVAGATGPFATPPAHNWGRAQWDANVPAFVATASFNPWRTIIEIVTEYIQWIPHTGASGQPP